MSLTTVKVGEWTLTFRHYSVRDGFREEDFTEVTSPFETRASVQFEVIPVSAFWRWHRRLLGFSECEFQLDGDDRGLLASQEIRRLLPRAAPLVFAGNSYGTRQGELRSQQYTNRLVSLRSDEPVVTLFEKTLEHLRGMGLAEPTSTTAV